MSKFNEGDRVVVLDSNTLQPGTVMQGHENILIIKYDNGTLMKVNDMFVAPEPEKANNENTPDFLKNALLLQALIIVDNVLRCLSDENELTYE